MLTILSENYTNKPRAKVLGSKLKSVKTD